MIYLFMIAVLIKLVLSLRVTDNRDDYGKNSTRSKNGAALVERGERVVLLLLRGENEFALEDKDVLEGDENDEDQY
ncbi:hypothetical protein ACS0TY_013941 [Phlomoides rotata]